MPSSNPTLRVVVTEQEKQLIESLAKSVGKSVSTFLKDLALVSQQVSQLNEVSQPSKSFTAGNRGQVSQPVCVLAIGTKLPLVYEAKPFKIETISMGYKRHKRDWYVYPEDRVVAIWNKSANGSQKWLEVAEQFPEEVWLAATQGYHFSSSPLSTLREYQRAYNRIAEFDSQPIIAEAISRGWSYEWVKLKHSEDILTNKAEIYLNNLPVAEVQPVSTVDEVPSVLTIEELATRLSLPNTSHLLSVGGAKMKPANIAKFTSSHDPNSYTHLPTDATRQQWARQGKESTV
ncbi:hypothetical protein [uncultured Nostoc sp.]|uniref:hypothetical protein n=1 Tax=uncultured Nostoc sp. TaxID=340711 RepID=UPI0035CC9525